MKELWNIVNPLIEDRFTTEWDHLNYSRIPVTVIEAKPGNEVLYNEIYRFLLQAKQFQPIKRTESHGISISLINRFRFDQYDIRQLGVINEITIVTLEKSCRIQFRLLNVKKEDRDIMTSTQYFKDKWLPACRRHGISMLDYAVNKEEGLKYQEEIHKYDVQLLDISAIYKPKGNVHHIDFHKFFASGLINTHPEFRPVIEDLLKEPHAKEDLAALIGWFHSNYNSYKFAKLSRDAINDAYSRYDKVKQALKDNGRHLILTNVDGIWYTGDIYHGEFEGPELTQWENDHTNCIIWCKSSGIYQYIENDKCHTVYKGHCEKDKKKPDRDTWEFGEIFDEDTKTKLWSFKEGVGIIWQEH